MTRERIGIEEVKPQLQARIDDLIAKLFPDAKPTRASSVRVHNPDTGNPDPTLAIYRRGVKVGGWKDFQTGDTGDVLDLIAHVNGLDRKGALAWAKDFLGLARMSDAERKDALDAAARRRADMERKAQEDEREKIRRVGRLWLKADPLFSDTPADRHARAYMAARKCPFEAAPHLDAATFRTLPALEYWELAVWKTVDGKPKKVKQGPELPCLLSAFKAPTGQVMALHITFLHPTEPRKADLPKGKDAKLMFGPVTGCVLRIAHGPDHRDVPQDPHELILCEGVEDGLTIAQLWPTARVWVAGSLGHLASVDVSYPFISKVILARDNDTLGGEAEQQFEVAFAALERQGKGVSIARPQPPHKDFNDWLRDGDDDDPA